MDAMVVLQRGATLPDPCPAAPLTPTQMVFQSTSQSDESFLSQEPTRTPSRAGRLGTTPQERHRHVSLSDTKVRLTRDRFNKGHSQYSKGLRYL